MMPKRSARINDILHAYKFVIVVLLGVGVMSCGSVRESFQASSQTGHQQDEYLEYSGWGFSVQIPPSVVVQEEPCTDFLLYRFRDATHVKTSELLVAYAGNYPDFGEMHGSAHSKKRSFRIHGLKAKDIQWSDHPHQFSREVLVKIPYTYEPGRRILYEYIHFWYYGLSDDERRIADNIITSIMAVGE